MAGNGVNLSGIEWDGAPQAGESWNGFQPQPVAGRQAAEQQPPTAIGPLALTSEPWFANRPPVVPHPNWYQPLPPPPRRRRGRVLAAVGAAAVVIIGAVVVAVIASPKSGSPHASSPPRSSSPPASSSSSRSGSASSSHAGAVLTAGQAVKIASRHSARLTSVSATFSESINGRIAATITGDVTEQRYPLLASMNLKVSTGGVNITMSAILNSRAIYIKVNGTSLGLPATLARKWIKIPFAQFGSGSSFVTVLRGVHNDNPAQAQLLLAAEHLRAVGTAELRGVATTKYTGWFTPSVAVRYLSPSMRTALAPVLKLITGKVNFTVWIDAQHRIRQLIEVEQVASSTVTNTYRFFGFNKPVHIALPPASEVATPPTSALSSAA